MPYYNFIFQFISFYLFYLFVRWVTKKSIKMELIILENGLEVKKVGVKKISSSHDGLFLTLEDGKNDFFKLESNHSFEIRKIQPDNLI